MYHWTNCIYNLFSKFTATDFKRVWLQLRRLERTLSSNHCIDFGVEKPAPPESAAIYLLKFSNGNTRIIFEICFNLTTETVDRRHWYCSGVFIVNFEQTSHIFWCFPCCHFLVFPLFPYFPIYLLFRLAINRLESNEK